MNEFFGYARSVSFLLLAVSLAILVFSITPRSNINYERALLDIEYFKKLEVTDYIDSSDEKGAIKYYPKLASEIITREIKKLDSTIMISPDAVYSGNIILDYPRVDGSIANLIEHSNFSRQISYTLPSKITLEELLPSILGRNGNKKGKCLNKGVDSSDEKSEPIIKSCKPVNTDLVYFGSWSYRLGSQTSFPILRGENDKFILILTFINKHTGKISLYADFYTYPREIDNTARFSEWFSKLYNSESSITEADGKTNPFLKVFFKFQDKPDITLKGLKILHDEIERMSIVEAENFLKNEIVKNRQNINLLGQNIDERILTVVSPCILFALVLALNSAVSMIGKVINVGNESLNDIVYPWFCLWSDTASTFISNMIILIFPNICFIIILLSPIEGRGLSFILSLTLFFSSLYYSYLTKKSLNKIKSLIKIKINPDLDR
ncbi:hypothetical protein Z042_06925 [Chania multitudinisentens RB-25]|uniref:Uncharacterized protein n=1 Tax=Chania multitudinisentens RB-25 TaxID=1441930 RepID=W0LFP6_9GAMM|nr:hypothetical protein [Chania multitudinisentens]AHG22688.1 hypothetical protein Z042_06925 [Chania multitudinisentens RB-25]